MERDIHPSETPLFIAAALRGLRLEDTKAGLYRVMRGAQVVADEVTFADVANLCGAVGSTTLRQAAERDGLSWPTTPEAFLATLQKI